MRVESIVHPPAGGDESYIIIHTWQLKFCDDNHVAAALLSFFESFHNTKLANRSQAITAKDAGQDMPKEMLSLLQWHTQSQLVKGIARVCKTPKTIKKAVDLLIEKGAITVHDNPNPRFAFDNTIHYLFHPKIVQDWINENYDLTAPSPATSHQPKPPAPKKKKEPKPKKTRSVSDMDGAEMLAAAPHRKGETDRWKMGLMGTFLVATGYRIPKHAKERGFWWSQIGEIHAICNEDVEKGKATIKQAVRAVKNDQLDINSPKSIVFKVRALASSVQSSAAVNGVAVSQDDSAMQFLSEEQKEALRSK